jgi:ribosome-binding protein aMBF1 (putative translation factor)
MKNYNRLNFCDWCGRKVKKVSKVEDVVDFQRMRMNVCQKCKPELLRGTFVEVIKKSLIGKR